MSLMLIGFYYFLFIIQIYGSESCTADKLRLFAHGELVESQHPKSIKGLPQLAESDEFEDCRSLHKCYVSGDKRYNPINAASSISLHINAIFWLLQLN